MTPEMIEAVEAILRSSETCFDPSSHFPVYRGLGDPKRRAYLDFRFGEFTVMVHRAGPGEELGMRAVARLADQLAEIAVTLRQLKRVGAAVRA